MHLNGDWNAPTFFVNMAHASNNEDNLPSSLRPTAEALNHQPNPPAITPGYAAAARATDDNDESTTPPPRSVRLQHQPTTFNVPPTTPNNSTVSPPSNLWDDTAGGLYSDISMGGSEAIYTMPMREVIERIMHGQSIDPMW